MPTPHLRVAFLVPLTLVTGVAAQGLVVSPWAGASAIGDTNADGRVERITYDTATTVFTVFDGATGAPLPYLQRSGGSYVDVGDYDGDGGDDLAHIVATVLTVVSGRDGSTLATPAGAVLSVIGADMDGDGRSDLLRQEATGVRAVSSRTGADLWQQAGGLVPLRGDENGDGLDDAMVQFTYTIPILYTVTYVVRLSGGWASTIGFLQPLGDVDGDGRIDSIYLSIDGKTLVAGGSFAPLSPSSWSLLATFQALGDVDGDGRADFYRSDTFTSAPPRVVSGATLQALPGWAPASSPDPLAIGDVDGDGRAEFVVNGQQHDWADPSVPVASRMVRRGIPGATNDGRRPKVVARGHAGLGNRVFLDVRGGLPSSAALLLFGAAADLDLTAIGAPGNRSYTTLDGALLLATNANGVATHEATMPVTPSLLGASVSVQAAVFDELANALGFVFSSAIDVTTTN